MEPGGVLVLGSTGFVGRNVIELLRQSDVAVTSASRADGVDLRDGTATREMLRRTKPTVIINCAAHVGSLNYITNKAAQVVADNMRMILSLYEGVAQECPDALVVNPIANCAYPAMVSNFEEDRWWDGHLHRSVLSYGSTRRMLWATAECYQMEHGVRSVHFLAPNMYGPHDSADPNKAHALNAIVAKVLRAKAANADHVKIWGTGAPIREWLYAPDFARILLEVIRNPKMIGLGEPLNVGQNFGLSIRELVALIFKSADYKGSAVYDESMPDGVPRKVMDDRRFRKVFPKFEFTSLERGIDATVAYFRTVIPNA